MPKKKKKLRKGKRQMKEQPTLQKVSGAPQMTPVQMKNEELKQHSARQQQIEVAVQQTSQTYAERYVNVFLQCCLNQIISGSKLSNEEIIESAKELTEAIREECDMYGAVLKAQAPIADELIAVRTECNSKIESLKTEISAMQATQQNSPAPEPAPPSAA